MLLLLLLLLMYYYYFYYVVVWCEKNMDVVTKQAGTTSVVGETILHKVQYTKETTARFVWRWFWNYLSLRSLQLAIKSHTGRQFHHVLCCHRYQTRPIRRFTRLRHHSPTSGRKFLGFLTWNNAKSELRRIVFFRSGIQNCTSGMMAALYGRNLTGGACVGDNDGNGFDDTTMRGWMVPMALSERWWRQFFWWNSICGLDRPLVKSNGCYIFDAIMMAIMIYMYPLWEMSNFICT